jgi:RNA polymerase-binding transcription factor DksA
MASKPVKKSAPAKKKATPVKKAAPAKKKAAPAKKVVVKKAVPAKKKPAPVKRVVVKKVAVKKAVPAKKKAAPVKKAPAKKAAPAKKVVAKKAAPAKKVVVKKAAVKKVVVKKVAPAKKVVVKKVAPAKKVVAKKVVAKMVAPIVAKVVIPVVPKKAPKPVFVKPAVPGKKPVTKDGIISNKDFDLAFLRVQRGLLVAERDRLLGRAETLESELEKLIEEAGMGDDQFDEDGGEGDTMAVERERDRVLSDQARQTVEEIDAALVRICTGDYGYSVVSTRPIPRERLEAIPWAIELVEEKVGGIGRR